MNATSADETQTLDECKCLCVCVCVCVCVCACVCVGSVRLYIHTYIQVVRPRVECVRVCVWCVSSVCCESLSEANDGC
jgi:hypothetical protein